MILRDARKLFSIHDVLGEDSRKNPVMCPFPEHAHANNTPSLNIYWRDGVEKFVCMGSCGKKGDVIDMVGYLHIPNYDDKNANHIKMAISRLGQGYKAEYRTRPKKRVLLSNLYMDYLPPTDEVFRYAATRGLDRDTLDRFSVGDKMGAMSMPYFEFGLLRGIKFRSLSSGKYWMEKGSRNGIFNHDEVNYYDGPILFLKSEIPTMLAAQCGFVACGLTGGEQQKIEDWKHVFSFSSKVIYVADNDRNLDVRRLIMAAAHDRASKIRAEVQVPPENYKDWDEWFLADTRSCLETTRRWLNE